MQTRSLTSVQQEGPRRIRVNSSCQGDLMQKDKKTHTQKEGREDQNKQFKHQRHSNLHNLFVAFVCSARIGSKPYFWLPNFLRGVQFVEQQRPSFVLATVF